MELSPRNSPVKLVNSATGEMSDIELSPRPSHVRLINPVRGEISDIELSQRYRCVRLIANSSPVKSLMLALSSSRWVKVSISATVIGSPDTLPRVASDGSAEVGIGDIQRTCAGVVSGIVRRKSIGTTVR